MLKSRHDFIRYANCWEDADYLLAALETGEGNRILSIASAGDNSLALLSTSPELLVAADVNPVQLFLVELKAVLFKHLEYEDILSFLSEAGRGQWETYRQLSGHLSTEARHYWSTQRDKLERGLMYSGKFERYLRIFRRNILPLIHKQSRVEELFEPRNRQDREVFYREVWDNMRWKLLFRIFFSRFLLGRLGRDPEFLKHVEMEVGSYIYQRTGEYLSAQKLEENFYLHFMLKGSFEPSLPFYLRRENYHAIRNALGSLKLEKKYIHEVEGGNFTHCNFSNIFEYMSADEFTQFNAALRNKLKPGAKMAYWNLMVNRSLSETFPDEYVRLTCSAGPDKCFFYSRFQLDKKI